MFVFIESDVPTDNMFFSVVFLVLVMKVLTVPLHSTHNRTYRSRSILPITIEAHPRMIDTIAAGTQMAIEHCQHMFQWERWNCPKTTFTRQQKLLPTRETAFTKAIVAAAIVHAITNNCSRGQLPGCGCDTKLSGTFSSPLDYTFIAKPRSPLEVEYREQSLNEAKVGDMIQWSWGGCSDHPSYAVDMTKKFLDALDKELDPAAYVARHNSKIGRDMVRSTMTRRCKCHGISGSCSFQTCWMQIAPFEEISKKLKERYKNSERVSYEVVEKSIYMENSARGMVKEKAITGVEHSLVYLDQSPDYCIPNVHEGIPGTKGRMCSRKANYTNNAEKTSCRNLCKKCGYGVKKMQKTVMTRCNCKFEWCCEVKCDTCKERVDEHFCV